jgi:predicted AAA+ superfamily ATPase
MTLTDLIYQQSPWFLNPGVTLRESGWFRRELFEKLFALITKTRQITSLVGLRRTGKSTLLKQVIIQLLASKISPKQILFFAFDQPTVAENTETIEALLAIYEKEVLGQKLTACQKQIYLFLDEIQLVPFWQDILKRYYDLNPNLKFVVSGSSSLFIFPANKESLAGRIFTLTLPPLKFSEYQKLTNDNNFLAYLEFGQFPEILDLPNQEMKINYLREGVIGKVLEIDLPKIAPVRHAGDLERLFWSLLPNTGQIIQPLQLMTDLGIKKATLAKYLTVLEQTLLIQKTLNLSGSFRSASRLLRKFYPAAANFLSVVSEPLNLGFKVEAYVASILASKTNQVFLYHQRGKEIDFVLPEEKIAAEVKYRERLHPRDWEFLANWAKKEKYQAVVITKGETPTVKNGPLFVPVAKLETNFPKI